MTTACLSSRPSWVKSSVWNQETAIVYNFTKKKLEFLAIHYYLFVPTQVCRGEYVGECSEPMEQHGGELNHYDECEKEHEYQTDGFQV